MRVSRYKIVPSVFDTVSHESLKIFTEPALQPPPPTTNCLREDAADRIAVFNSALEECKNIPISSEYCDITKTDFFIEGITEPVRMDKELGHGTFGFVYKTNFPNIVIKYGSVCVDKAVMEALKDVDDPLLPKEYKIISPKNIPCKSSILVMNRIGEQDWFDLMSYRGKQVPLKDGFTRIFRMISALKKYHSLGFAHGDYHQKNIRVDETNPNFIGIIDLGESVPLIRAAGESLPDEFSHDLVYAVENIRDYLMKHKREIDTDWIEDGLEFFASAEYVAGICPNYDLWIWVFDQLANSDNPNIFNRLKELIFPTYFSIFQNLIHRKIANALNNGKSVSMLKFPKSFRPPIPERFIGSSNRAPKKILPVFIEFFEQQKIIDSQYPETRPYLMLDSELIYEPSAVTGNLEPRIIPMTSNVKTAKNSCEYISPKYKIEYRVNCDDLDDDLMMMQREFGMLKLGGELGIGFKAIWMSPPVKLPYWNSGKLLLELSQNEIANCQRDPRSHVRYMVTENWEYNFESNTWFLNIRTPLERVELGLKFAIFFIKKFKITHRDHGIVFGQMRPRNIAFKEINGEYTFKLDEFGKSFFNAEFSPDCEGCALRPSAEPDQNPCYQTHWNIDGSRVGFRDDTLNVLLVAAWIMSKNNREKNFCPAKFFNDRDITEIKEWKKTGSIFGDIHSVIGGDTGEFVSGALDAALETTRTVADIDDLPNHDSILLSLESALLAIRK